ncbi:tetratricopeptide repeat protein [Aquitalea magnusonii]|uniref:Tetratricopeptide (TPR) repeat protein n=1 Tax=Aquitalea magnusonii TaxID=332411 RepID=A0A318JC60_9NEIS|nr:tetratricopeptide repeat-containing glycosyltransferase family protein [Aquitalea magnusonii]PXX44348.1 tetratricopeptide (TPR) repeat protein [Aquitalea magnusonii]
MRETAFERGNRLAAADQQEQAIAAFSECLRHNAQDWQALFNRGTAQMRLKHYPLALEDYLAAAALKPTSTNIKCNLAVLLKELGELTLAENLLLEVLQAEPEHVDAWSNLGVVLQYALRYDDAVICHQNALQLAGASAGRLNNLGNALTCALRLDEAVSAYRQGMALAGADAFLAFNLSVALLLQGRYREAWPLYEQRWDSIIQPRYRDRAWQGQDLGQQSLLIWAEQGLGDTLQMVRFLPELQRRHPSARLMLACQNACLRLFAQLPNIELLPLEDAPPAHDWQLPLMSLPLRLGIEPDNLSGQPYLHADLQLAHTYAARLPPCSVNRPRIGIVWETGSWGVGIVDHSRQNKSVPLEQFLPLLDSIDADFISLQLGEQAPELQGRVHQLPISDFADTAAIISQLDLVISVDTSVVHLAGALGKPVWVLMRAESAPFFMAQGDTSPWYASMRIWRQATPGDWPPLIARVAKTLRQWPRD